MTGGADKVVLGPCDPESLRPDLRWLEAKMKQPDRPKMVVRPFSNPSIDVQARRDSQDLQYADSSLIDCLQMLA